MGITAYGLAVELPFILWISVLRTERKAKMQNPSDKKPPTTDTTPTQSNILWGEHSYEVYTPICTLGGKCTQDNIFNIMKSRKSFVTPTWQTAPVTNDSTTQIPVLGTVKHTVDQVNHTVTNTTLPDHLLNPGVVQRQIVQRGNEIGVLTKGTGDGLLPRQNECLAPYLWGSPDSALKDAFKDQKD